ncbi:Afadin [Acipenser ruthenus]|uniref:Afadin n=1 Tax=Acipenser ruthenus TaxID=7906 RepID=A0A662Z002_ACIRT|nr:Afadin [Acipenser ruthenus]
MSGSREEERRKLADIINHWNANRLDLFEISQPTEDLEFHGVMRFYFQDRVAGNFATKCIRVSSTATTQDVIETLAEKFRPDMRMLSSPRYSLYEVHVSGGRGNHYAYYSYRQQEDGSDSRDKPKLYRLQMSVTEVGSDKIDENSIQLFGPGIQPHHCDLTHMDGMVTVIPSFDAETYVDGQQIAETTMLRSGMKVQFGSSHVFKFVDPSYDHGMTKRSMDAGPMVKGQRHKSGSVPETTFELDGDIHSGTPLPTSKSSSRLDIERSTLGERSMVKPMVREQQQDYRKQESRSQDGQGPELMLPASIEFRESSEDAFLSAIINYTNSSTVHFKLSPTYVLYMTCRYVLSSHFRPDMSPSERTHKVIAIVNKMVSTMEGVIQKQKNIAGALAFWMANASELLNFIKQDKDLSRVTLDAQDVLAHLVQMAFKYLVHCLQSDLNNYMPAFLEDPEEQNPQRPKIEDVLNTLTGAMSLLRRCRVNAALTIQLFSQLFHFINMWLFNKLVTEPDSELCSHYWGAILRQQLGHIEAWAEKQGLELAADCHLSRIVQATTLLTMDKYSMQDVPNINNTCFKLNSLQLQALLQNYHCAPDEPYIPPDLIENVVAVAENTADELARSDGREVQLEEDPDLQLPFLLPEDGYSCDVVRNIPNGFQEFLEPLCQRGYCRLTPHPRSPGTWTMYFEGADYENHFSNDSTELPMPKDPEIVTVTLKKHNGMGLSIVAAKGAGQEKLGIYVKSVVKGGAADIDGRLAAGDQLLSVDGRSLVGLSQERAAELMTRTGSVVTLEVAKQGAIYHGLATLLNQPSPMMQRASDRGRGSGKPRPKSEGFELYNNSAQNGSPESPQMSWGEPPEPKKTSGEERLLKNRADHRSSPNVANQAQSPGGKPVYSGGPTSKITSVSTGNLCTDEQQPSPHPEAYPIPTQTYTREYFTFPASKSQDRMGPGPEQQWQNYEDRPPGQPDDHHSSNMSIQRVTRSQEELCDDRVSYQPERMRQEEIVQMQQREMEYQRERDNGEHWNHQVSSSVESSTSSQEHLNYSSSSSKAPNHKSGPGRWKTPGPPNSAPVAVSQPIQSDLLPPPPPPPPVYYTGDFDSQADLPLPLPPPPPGGGQQQAIAAAADRKKRDEQQRWYEKEKARLEDERDRKRREQDRKLGQVRIPPGPGVPPNLNHHHQQQQPPLSPMPIQHQQHQHPPPPMSLQQQQYHPPPMVPQQPPWIEKPSSLPRAPPPPQDTVIRELLPQQQPRTIERRDLQYIVSKEDLNSGDSLSPDPWKRDAREKMEKQQQLHIVDMLNKEIQELQVKPERTAEENDRLRKLMLEWQFQKRLQESKQNEEDEEEEDDEDVDTMLIMQRLEAEKRARLQDEERRRKQQLEEIRKREAEERAKQEERLRREEERNRREAEEKQRRQEEEYYNRLEAERRRQHDEAERKLLPPDEPGLYRPPLPRDYELPPPPPPSANAPPPPPQRNTSYLKTQVVSPDTVYTAKFVSYNDEEEDSSLAGQGKEERIIQLETENALLHLKLAEVLKQNLRDLSSIYAGFSKELEQQSKNFLNKVIAASCKIQDCSVDVNSKDKEFRGNIRVHCRVRPFLSIDVGNNDTDLLSRSATASEKVVHAVNDDTILVKCSRSGYPTVNKMFEFERVYSPDDSQQTVFEEVRPLLTSLLDGYNVCIMAYGQTGSGKTHTMIGPHSENGFRTGELPEEGVIPKATRELFSLISKKSPGSHSIEVSVVEVYNNEIFDLLAKDGDGSMLIMKRDVITTSTGNSDVPSLTHESVENAAEIMHVFNHGLQLRAKHPTLVHADSSRSHLVVTITVTTQCASAEGLAFSLQSVRQESLSHRSRRQPPKLRVTDEQTMIRSRSPSPRPSLTELPVLHKPVKTKLQLVDLAGSECVGMSGVTGVALRETSFINRSLSALSDVLGALAEQRPHIPYRNSKLTHLLQDSIGGDAKLLVMLCVSPTQRGIHNATHPLSPDFKSDLRAVNLTDDTCVFCQFCCQFNACLLSIP